MAMAGVPRGLAVAVVSKYAGVLASILSAIRAVDERHSAPCANSRSAHRMLSGFRTFGAMQGPTNFSRKVCWHLSAFQF